jgi:hypothetical protein
VNLILQYRSVLLAAPSKMYFIPFSGFSARRIAW